MKAEGHRCSCRLIKRMLWARPLSVQKAIWQTLHPLRAAPRWFSTRIPYIMEPAEVETVISFGSLMSEVSARSTFPELSNFRYGKVKNHRYGHTYLIVILVLKSWASMPSTRLLRCRSHARRVFLQAPSIFVTRGIARLETKVS